MKRTHAILAMFILCTTAAHTADTPTPTGNHALPTHTNTPAPSPTPAQPIPTTQNLATSEQNTIVLDSYDAASLLNDPLYDQPYDSNSFEYIGGTIKDYAHYYSNSFGGLGDLLVNYAGKVSQAAALTTSNRHSLRSLYSISLATRVVDGTGNTLAACTPTPGQSRLQSAAERKYGKNVKIKNIAGPALVGRIYHFVMGGMQMARIPFNIKLLSNADKLSRLYKHQPRLNKSLKRARNARIKNATLGLGIHLLTSLIVSAIADKVSTSNREDDKALRICLSRLFGHLLCSVLLNRRPEQNGIEKELIAHAKRLAREESKPFFNPPANTATSVSNAAIALMRLKPNEIKLGEQVAGKSDEFEELDDEVECDLDED